MVEGGEEKCSDMNVVSIFQKTLKKEINLPACAA
jgi:hypothetical protein